MANETVGDKARRLAEAGAVTYLETLDTDDGVHRFSVEGDNGTYEVLVADAEDSTCTCPAKTHCAHAAAVELHQEAHEPDPEIVDDIQPPTAELATPADPVALDRARYQQLSVIVETDFVPKAYRGKPAAALAAVKSGEEYGLGMMESLRSIDVVNGSAEPNAELKLRLYRQAGHRLEVVEHTNEVCTVRGVRVDTGDEVTVSYSMADAQAAKLDGKDVWLQHPMDMLWARAVTRLVRRLAPDALAGQVQP